MLQVASSGAKIVVSSNVEDVAVTIRESFLKLGGVEPILQRENPILQREAPTEEEEVPRRTQRWIDQGGSRARGEGWLATSIIPKPAVSETEAYYAANKKPIHRCAFTVTPKKTKV